MNTIGLRSCYCVGKRIAETLCSDYQRMHGIEIWAMRIIKTHVPGMFPDDVRFIRWSMAALQHVAVSRRSTFRIASLGVGACTNYEAAACKHTFSTTGILTICSPSRSSPCFTQWLRPATSVNSPLGGELPAQTRYCLLADSDLQHPIWLSRSKLAKNFHQGMALTPGCKQYRDNSVNSFHSSLSI